MKEATPPDVTGMELREWFTARFTRNLNIRLAGAAAGLALALLIAPGSRRLFLAQTGLCVPMPQTVASIAGSQLGIKPDSFEGATALRAAAAAAARHPDDIQAQIAYAAMLPPDSGMNASLMRVQRLRALETRFENNPSVYANVLRYETMGEIRVRHSVEQEALSSNTYPNNLENARKQDAKSISPQAYAAYDRDAAQGERLDPENAYFPFMRAVGLFGQHRDQEALEAIASAASKSQWREYYNDELKGQWRLQDESSVNNSALFHSLSAMAILFPQYAQMRAAVRVTIYKAMQAEQAGHVKEGLALRENVVRLGSLMRVQSANLIGALVGNALTEHALARPGGLPAVRIIDDEEHDNKAAKEKIRSQFDAYLQRVNLTSAMGTFHDAQKSGDAMKEIVREGSKSVPYDRPFSSLVTWWVMDLVTLSNILWLLLLGGIAGLLLRSPRLKAGKALPEYARMALPLGLIGGAFSVPFLLPQLSAYFQNINGEDSIWMLLAGFSPVLLLLSLPASTSRERLNRIGVFAASLLSGAILTGFYFWQLHGIANISTLMQVFFNLSSEGSATRGSEIAARLFWCTPYVSLLILGGGAIISRVCRVPISVGLARGFRGLMVPVAAILFLLYGGLLLCTIRSEAAVQYSLNRTLDNEGQYMADLSHKQWPRSDVARKMVNHN